MSYHDPKQITYHFENEGWNLVLFNILQVFKLLPKSKNILQTMTNICFVLFYRKEYSPQVPPLRLFIASIRY